MRGAMKHIHYTEAEEIEVDESGTKGINLRWVIAEKDGAQNFYMRTVSFKPGAYGPDHSHPYEHEMFILSGSATLEVDDETVQLKPGDVVYIPPNAHHCFRTEEPMEMICLIPRV